MGIIEYIDVNESDNSIIALIIEEVGTFSQISLTSAINKYTSIYQIYN